MIIRFNYRIPGFRIKSALQHRNWLLSVLLEEGFSSGVINFVFTDDSEILRINNEFLKHNYYTDVITFDYSDSGQLSGEIYISIETVRNNADIYGVPFVTELRRVMVHGILHLCRYNDSTKSEIAEMREKEGHYLKGISE